MLFMTFHSSYSCKLKLYYEAEAEDDAHKLGLSTNNSMCILSLEFNAVCLLPNVMQHWSR